MLASAQETKDKGLLSIRFRCSYENLSYADFRRILIHTLEADGFRDPFIDQSYTEPEDLVILNEDVVVGWDFGIQNLIKLAEDRFDRWCLLGLIGEQNKEGKVECHQITSDVIWEHKIKKAFTTINGNTVSFECKTKPRRGDYVAIQNHGRPHRHLNHQTFKFLISIDRVKEGKGGSHA